MKNSLDKKNGQKKFKNLNLSINKFIITRLYYYINNYLVELPSNIKLQKISFKIYQLFFFYRQTIDSSPVIG